MVAPDNWSRVEALYHAALERDAGERAAFLDAACADDAELRREVESLLAQPSSSEGVFEWPAVAVAAAMISDHTGSAMIGRRLGAYELQSQLGADGMGEVYRARDIKLGRDAAILPPSPSCSTGMRTPSGNDLSSAQRW